MSHIILICLSYCTRWCYLDKVIEWNHSQYVFDIKLKKKTVKRSNFMENETSQHLSTENSFMHFIFLIKTWITITKNLWKRAGSSNLRVTRFAKFLIYDLYSDNNIDKQTLFTFHTLCVQYISACANKQEPNMKSLKRQEWHSVIFASVNSIVGVCVLNTVYEKAKSFCPELGVNEAFLQMAPVE